MLWRDDDPEEDLALLYDTCFLIQEGNGQWRPPSASAGSAYPEWVLHRPERGADLEPWQGSELVPLGGQWGLLDGVWVTDLTVMASRVVAEVGITYGRREFRRSVPPNGVLTVPALAGEVDEFAVFVAYDEAGGMVGQVRNQPLDADTHQWLNGISGL